MTLEPVSESRPPRRRPTSSPARVAVGALAVGLVVGGIVGFLARGGGGTSTVTVAPTTTATRTTPPASAAATARRLRAETRLVVLNGTSITGLAARNEQTARRAGWKRVSVGNGPPVSGTSQLYALAAARPAALLAARDLNTLPPRALPADSPLRAQFPRGEVFVLLGPSADVPVTPAPSATDTTGTAPVETAPADTTGTTSTAP